MIPPSETQLPLPFSLKVTYYVFFINSIIDVALFTFIPRVLAKGMTLERQEFFAYRSTGVTLIPLALFFYNFHHHHPSTPIGSFVLRVFAFYHSSVFLLDGFTLWEEWSGHDSGFRLAVPALACHGFWVIGALMGRTAARKQIKVQ
ncbi:hypothetical protein BOTBODRAFT_38366 [Botryobasidium botryosum FD-172 SS1]|uniref:Uncharacterized protein n=1 Tax=Botryobasidium botryosum (strain FD-172 SS1) TaxID=930990 RepID=A0A067LXK8_BOTB1|nr:hypothetical protein BOTBODRAFT_38366 [Botryobasidium botryosum FD-172 SS1]